jgi:hypothetical protein
MCEINASADGNLVLLHNNVFLRERKANGDSDFSGRTQSLNLPQTQSEAK